MAQEPSPVAGRDPSELTTKRRTQIEALFETALDQRADERAAWLAAACAGDGELHAEVIALLAAHERAEGVLEADVAGAAAPLVDEIPAGEPIGPYRVLRELGRGGMGAVYLAERDDGDASDRVAVKVLHGALAGPRAEQLRRRFELEQKVLAALNHPNIARLLDGGVTDSGRLYFVMEYVGGAPINEYCEQKRLSIDERLRLFCTVARAVHHAHATMAVHRDLKPSNIFVTTDGVVKLLDFGIAKVLDRSSVGLTRSLTRTGQMIGTPAYTSPEQVLGAKVSTATDVYALGLLLHELVSGCRAFDLRGRPQSSWQRIIIEEESALPSQAVRRHPRRAEMSRRDLARLRRRLRGDIDCIVLKALEKEPAKRYASAQEIADEVQCHLDGGQVKARKNLADRARRLARGVRWRSPWLSGSWWP